MKDSSKKTLVVVDRNGFIVATAQPTIKPTGEGAPTHVTIGPSAGHTALVVDLPAEALKLPSIELHQQYKVDLQRGVLVALEKVAAK